MSLVAQVEHITPEKAMVYLEKNKLNRPVRLKWVLSLSRQMTEGLWHLSGEPIIFSTNDNLLDGQHRLKSIVHSNTSQYFLVVHGAKEETFTTIDTGIKRSPKDALYVAGFSHSGLYARLGVGCLRWNRGIFFGSSNIAVSPTNDEIVDYVKRHEKPLSETVNHFMQIKNRLRGLIQGHVMIFAYHQFAALDENDAFIFTEKLISGMFNADREQPIRVLRERMLINSQNEAKLPPRIVYYMVFAAWNAFRQNKIIGNLDVPKSFITRKGGRVTLV